MEHIVVLLLNTALATPDPLETPLGTAGWWGSAQRSLGLNTVITHGKPRFSQELSDELRRVRAQLSELVASRQAAFHLSGVPGGNAVLFPLLEAASQLHRSGRMHRIKRCAHDACSRYFLDETKNGSKRWCSLRCMERARAPRRRTISG
jgi:predicted RNA-binding Zn ribbon-like protein